MTETPYFKDIAPPAYLVLIDGPAAREVGAVFREGLGPYPPEGTFGRTPEEVGEAQQRERWCGEVREFLAACRLIAQKLTGRLGFRDSLPAEIAEAAGSLPGGEAWLVGLVLPSKADINPDLKFPGGWADYVTQAKRCCSTCCDKAPARLAILAPEPPPLLVERVRAWGGEVWECGISAAPATAGKCLVTFGTKCFYADTWPEVVRAALGEVAP